jgi:hypothetical protein
VPVHHRE